MYLIVGDISVGLGTQKVVKIIFVPTLTLIFPTFGLYEKVNDRYLKTFGVSTPNEL